MTAALNASTAQASSVAAGWPIPGQASSGVAQTKKLLQDKIKEVNQYILENKVKIVSKFFFIFLELKRAIASFGRRKEKF